MVCKAITPFLLRFFPPKEITGPEGTAWKAFYGTVDFPGPPWGKVIPPLALLTVIGSPSHRQSLAKGQ